ncbi:Inositolphosphorylceramide synthase subunit Kei1-domain-containing protein [Lipomyces kononenkoae]|uniref:Inositolphosphorylceramide synthase subunit Kei1-domain-containing protein n=1 Tax=Lipomyces kononenkoae TaxID=34357 RepID=A0ACC3T6C5_LIPKO
MPSIVPKQYFLGFIPLAAGAELITVFGVVNKASGIYGTLSIFTGHPITAVQLVLNIISLVLLPVFLYALHNVRRQNALPVVAFSYIYFFDMLANIAFTIFFSVSWFRAFKVTAAAEASQDTTTSVDTASERGLSITIIVLVLLCKIYFSFALFGYARLLVRKAGMRADNGEGKFARRLQYIMLTIAPSFWRRGSRRAGKARMVNTLEEGTEMY